MSTAPRITYAQRPEAPPEDEGMILADIYQYILNCRAKKEAASPGGPDDGTRIKEDSADASIPKTPRRAAT